MLNRIITGILYIILILFSSISLGNATCTYQEGSLNATVFLDNCKPKGAAMTDSIGGEGIDGIKSKIVIIADGLIWLGSLLSVGAIVIGGFLYASSMGSDEKVKKGKNAVIYGLIGLLVMMFSFPAVNAIIEFIYEAEVIR